MTGNRIAPTPAEDGFDPQSEAREEVPEALVLPDPLGGCACTWHQYGAHPYWGSAMDYNPACPVHSEHLYDPRTGSFIPDPRRATREGSEQ